MVDDEEIFADAVLGMVNAMQQGSYPIPYSAIPPTERGHQGSVTQGTEGHMGLMVAFTHNMVGFMVEREHILYILKHGQVWLLHKVNF